MGKRRVWTKESAWGVFAGKGLIVDVGEDDSLAVFPTKEQAQRFAETMLLVMVEVHPVTILPKDKA